MLNGGEQRLNAVDVLNLTAILLLTIGVAVWRRELGEQAFWLAAVLASVLLFTLLAALLSGQHFRWVLVHDFSPIVTIPVIFNTLGPLIEVARPERWDATFARIDASLFGTLPALWQGILGRPAWGTDVAYVAYATYYLAPVVLAAIIYRRRPLQEFRRLAFTVTFTFYVAYVGYVIFPALGPRPAAGTEAAVVGGGALSEAIRAFIQIAERNRTDAFPSGHVAGALVCLYFAWSFSTVLRVTFAAVAAGIVLSTVYLHYHYVIDLVAGAVLAYTCVWVAPHLEAWLRPHEMMKHLPVRSDPRLH